MSTKGDLMEAMRKRALLLATAAALILAAPAAGAVEEIYAAEGKDAAKAYCESLKEEAEDKDAGEAAKEECDRALEAAEAAADED
jgi:hypothetical protein